MLPRASAPAAIGPYRVTGLVGKGGMATVFRVLHPTLGVERAVKVLAVGAGPGEASRAARFEREAQALARLRHPNVVGVHETGVDRGAPYFVMDLVPGRPLDRLIAEKVLDRPRALDLALQVARGVAALHAAGLVHRDLKPANVVVTPEGKAVVVDLGLAYDEGSGERLTKTGAQLGTPQYLAPEQLTSAAPSPRTDVHALGLLLHELLTGEPAFDAEDGFAMAAQVLAEDRPRAGALDPSVPAALEALALRAMAKDPAARHADAAAFAADLERCLAEPGLSAGAMARRRRLVALAAGVVAFGALAGALFAARGASPSRAGAPPTSAAASASTGTVTATAPPRAPAQAEERRWAVEVGLERTGLPGRRMQTPVVLLLHGGGRLQARFADARHVVTAEDGDAATTLRVWSLDDVRDPVREATLPDGPAPLLSGDRDAVVHAVRAGRVHAVRSYGALDLAPRGETQLAGLLLATLPDGRWVVRRHHQLALERPSGEEGAEPLLAPPWDLIAPTVATAELVASVRPTEAAEVLGIGRVNSSEVAVWSRASGAWRTRRTSFAVTALAAAPRGARIALGTYLGTLDLFAADDLERAMALEGTATGHERDPLFSRAHGGPVVAAAFDPDGARLVTASSGDERGRPDRAGVELRLWDVAEARQLALTAALERTPVDLDVSPDGRWLAVATREGVVEVWALPREARR